MFSFYLFSGKSACVQAYCGTGGNCFLLHPTGLLLYNLSFLTTEHKPPSQPLLFWEGSHSAVIQMYFINPWEVCLHYEWWLIRFGSFIVLETSPYERELKLDFFTFLLTDDTLFFGYLFCGSIKADASVTALESVDPKYKFASQIHLFSFMSP